MAADDKGALIPSTGERFVPTPSETEIELEHIQRYLAALPLCKGMEVLDAASGEGYGSAILAGAAKSVIGLDIDEASVEAANLRYGGSGARFQVGDIRALPFPDARFDVVTSFETLEHVTAHEEMLAEFKRVLKPDGLLIISTPDKRIYNQSLAEPNKFHLRELERDEFLAFLSERFAHVQMYGQRVVFGSLLVPEEPSGIDVLRRQNENTLKSGEAFSTAMYMVAVCSDVPAPSLNATLYEGGVPQNALSSLLGGIKDRDQRILELLSQGSSGSDEVAAAAAKELNERLATALRDREAAAAQADEAAREVRLSAARLEAVRRELEEELREVSHERAEAEKARDALAEAFQNSNQRVAAERAQRHEIELDAERCREGLRVAEENLGFAEVARKKAVEVANDLEAQLRAVEQSLAQREQELAHTSTRLERNRALLKSVQASHIAEQEHAAELARHLQGEREAVRQLRRDVDTTQEDHRAVLDELAAQVSYGKVLIDRAVEREAVQSTKGQGSTLVRDALFALRRLLARGPRQAARDFLAARTLRQTDLFDPVFYARTVRYLPPFVDPLHHYLAAPAEHRGVPSRRFSASDYLGRYADVADQGVEPLQHYLRSGRKEGRMAAPPRLMAFGRGESTARIGEATRVAPSVQIDASEQYKPDWLLARAPLTDPASMGLYDRRPDDAVPLEGLEGERFLSAHGLLGDKADFAGAVAALNGKSVAALTEGKPDVSIVIPIYGQLAYTLNCLDSLLAHESKFSFEVILIDDVSPDASGDHLPKVRGLRYFRQPENGGFVVSCNTGAAYAKGRFVVFLNNDTRVCPGWLNELIDSFDRFPKAGLVGSKLFYPDGSLQEAGGIFWKDGSAWNYGRNDDPNRPEYCYAREVDYVSGAAIALPTELWSELGGFDDIFRPAYCEDADIAFRVRRAGFETWLQPLSRVIHYEGKTSGTDLTKGVKAYQVVNGVKFLDRWKETLLSHRPNGEEPLLERERSKTKRALVIDAVTPTPDQDAGSVTTVTTLKIYQELGYKVYFVPQDNFLFVPGYTQALQAMGVECVYAPFELSFKGFIARHGHLFDVIQVYRVDIAARVIDDIRRYAPQAKVAFHNMDMHFLRLERQAALEGDAKLLVKAEAVKQQELALIRKVDCTIVHSPVEEEMLAKLVPEAPVVVFPYMVDLEGAVNSFAARKDIMFLGGYRHTPNLDAAVFFIEEIWPRLAFRLPDARFLVVGSHPPEALLALASDRVIITGLVEDLTPWFERSRIFAASIRYGAGIKGKVATSMAYGVPVVATEVAAEGMYLVDGETVLLADDPAEFAEAVYRLYTDEAEWDRFSRNSLAFVAERNSFAMGVETVKTIVAAAEAQHAKVRRVLQSS